MFPLQSIYIFMEVYKSAHSQEEQKRKDRFVKIRFRGYLSTIQRKNITHPSVNYSECARPL